MARMVSAKGWSMTKWANCAAGGTRGDACLFFGRTSPAKVTLSSSSTKSGSGSGSRTGGATTVTAAVSDGREAFNSRKVMALPVIALIFRKSFLATPSPTNARLATRVEETMR